MHESQVIGSIVAGAVGDALGFPVEFQSRQSMIVDGRGVEGFRKPARHALGTYSDDTQMTIAVAEGLIAAGSGATYKRAMTEIAPRFVAWSRSADNNRAPGNTCMQGCAALASGVPWETSGVLGSKGCGAPMRVAPVGLFWSDLTRVARTAMATSLPTHRHPTAIAASAAMALCVALAARGLTPREVWTEVGRRMEMTDDSVEFMQLWAKVPYYVTCVAPAFALSKRGLGEAWTAEDAVASAMYVFWRHPNDMRAALLEAVNTDGDSDTIGSLVGNILGARLGVDAIPEEWRRGVENSALLHDLGARLFAASAR